MLKGTVIENSLLDPSVLDNFDIQESRHAGSWRLHTVTITREEAEKFGKHIKDGPWYAHFWEEGTPEVLVVFKDKAFVIDHDNPATWREAVEFGKTLGIPEEQLDFVTG